MNKLVASALLLLVSACEAETILVASDQNGTTDSESDAGEFDCETDRNCADDEYCQKASCGASKGVCALRGPGCGAEQLPVCGCDGVTYFNDCLRKQRGVNLAHQGYCDRGPTRCGGRGGEACPSGAFCARVLRAPRPDMACESDAPGVCWVLPTSCDAEPRAGGDRFQRCNQPPECIDLCSAIRSEEPVLAANRCEPRGMP